MIGQRGKLSFQIVSTESQITIQTIDQYILEPHEKPTFVDGLPVLAGGYDNELSVIKRKKCLFGVFVVFIGLSFVANRLKSIGYTGNDTENS